MESGLLIDRLPLGPLASRWRFVVMGGHFLSGGMAADLPSRVERQSSRKTVAH